MNGRSAGGARFVAEAGNSERRYEMTQTVRNGVVAFLDILGFKSLLATLSLDQLAARYEGVTAQARDFMGAQARYTDRPSLFRNPRRGSSAYTQHMFSDSIILVANTDTEISCLELLLYAWRLEQLFLAAGMPLRGAIEYGEIYSNPGNGIALGKALSEAYRTEAEQDWIGICINESVTERYTQIFDETEGGQDWPAGVFREIFKMYAVPLKDGTVKPSCTINWRFNYVVEEGTRSLFSSDSDPSIQRKVRNTLEYARTIVDGRRLYTQNDEMLPVELGTFWVGGREPPFPHGDDL